MDCYCGICEPVIGYESDPRIEYLRDGMVKFHDSFGNTVLLPEARGLELMNTISNYQRALNEYMKSHHTGALSNILSSIGINRGKPDKSCSEMQTWATKQLAISLAFDRLTPQEKKECFCDDGSFLMTPILGEDWIINESQAYFFIWPIHQWSLIQLYGERWAVRFDPWLLPEGQVRIIDY